MKCGGKIYYAFGGHDKTLYIMNTKFEIVYNIAYDGWVRTSYAADVTGDGSDELLVGTGEGDCFVYHFDISEEKLVEIMKYRITGKINCCVAGDLFRDGTYALVYGGDNKQIVIFKDYSSASPILTTYYDDWVLTCTIGYLKIPKLKHPVYGLLVGTKSGQFQFLQIKDNNIDILYQMFLGSRINCIRIGDVSNDGYNEIVCCTDDSYIKIFNTEGERIRYIKIYDSRPVSLLIEDIDGDGANELTIGCANGFLIIYQNLEENSRNLHLKWKKRGENSIKYITSIIDEETKVRHMIYGGYERVLASIRDFEWGKKPKLQIPKHFTLSEIPRVKLESVKSISIVKHPESIQKISQEKALTHKKQVKPTEKEKKDEIPTEKEKKDEIPTEKEKKDEIPTEKEINEMAPSEINDSLDEIILTVLKEKEIVRTKTELVNSIISKGFEKEAIHSSIENLKKKNQIKYSQKPPQGWSVIT